MKKVTFDLEIEAKRIKDLVGLEEVPTVLVTGEYEVEKVAAYDSPLVELGLSYRIESMRIETAIILESGQDITELVRTCELAAFIRESYSREAEIVGKF